jgi:hydrogenase maturation protein HypF
LKQIKNGQMPLTSSCGRILDAISSLLGICFERTYEGEPAMKLESTALHGEDVLRLDPIIKLGIIDTTYLVHEIFENMNKYSDAGLACSAEAYIAESLAELAVDEARKIGVDTIGFSGGVAYNKHITLTIQRIVEENRLTFLVHDEVPPGDGGISLGQVIAASNSL